MLFTLKEYERIHRIISAVIESEGGNSAHSCVLYSIFGARILVDHFRMDAKVKCGLAAFHLGEDDQVLCFGERTENGLTGTENGFHCWVETNGWAIDFMAPNFGEINKTEFTSRPRMFQRELSEMMQSPNDMTRAGDFFLLHFQKLANTILLPVCEQLVTQDLADLCSKWFKKPPKKVPKCAATIDKNGFERSIRLKPIVIRLKW